MLMNRIIPIKDDLREIQEKVTSEMSGYLYIQENLPNLYNNSPAEILPLLSEENLPRLKALNDDPIGELYHDVQSEINIIKTELQKTYGLTEKDLDIDFTFTKDENGLPYNKIINDLLIAGVSKDGNLIPNKELIAQSGEDFLVK